MVSVDDLSLVTPSWKHHRVIHSKYPTENLYEKDDEINLILGEIASDTSVRVQYPTAYVDVDDVRYGEGWGAVMASFCYPSAGRFSTEARGAYYAGNCEHTSIAEWAHHTARLWRDFGYNSEVSAVVRCYTGKVDMPLVDIRHIAALHQHDPSYQYKETQAFAESVRAKNLGGVLYKSVRHETGENIALFRPPATTKVTQAAHYTMLYSGGEFKSYAHVVKFKRI
jgi:hypothetical protein